MWLSIFYPAPGSRDYGVCQNLGILPDSFALMRSTALPLDHTTSRIRAVTLLRLTRILNYMKSMVDIHGSLPGPRNPANATKLSADRNLASRTLLQWFLHDGEIRGMDPGGSIYVHKTDPALTRAFVQGIKAIQVMGVARGPARICPDT